MQIPRPNSVERNAGVKLSQMAVGSDYFVSNARPWMKGQGQRYRLLCGKRVKKGDPSGPEVYESCSNHGLPVTGVIDGKSVPIPGMHHPSKWKPGEDMNAAMARVADDGALGSPEIIHLGHVAGPWDLCLATAAVFRSGMDREERERNDRQERLSAAMTYALGREITLTIGKDGRVIIPADDLARVLAAAVEVTE